jgi:hypothetical protein
MNWTDYTNKIMKTVDNEAFFINELPGGQRHGSYEYKCSCPFKHLHKNADKSPSFTVNLKKGLYTCQTCKSRGNVHTLLMHLYSLPSEEAWTTLGDNLELERPDSAKPARPPIDVGLVVSYHKDLKANSHMLKILHEYRGLSDETITKAQIGWDGERLTIPIYNEFFDLVNIRRYKWDAPSAAEKFFNYTDGFENKYGELQLFGIEDLLDPATEVVLYPEGEMDKLICNQVGYKSVTPTSGTGSFRPEWVKLFKGKKVVVIQDNDEAGRNGANVISEFIHNVAEVFILQWPADFTEKGDPTDWFVKEKRSAEDFRKLVEEAIPYKKDTAVKDDTIIDLHLSKAANFENMGKHHRIPIMISGKDTAPYVAPRKVRITCQPSGKFCEGCGAIFSGGEHDIEFNAGMQDTLTLIQCTKSQQMMSIKEAGGIPDKCNKCKIEVLEYMNIEEIRSIPQADNDYSIVKDSEYVVRKCYYIGKDIKTNQRYTMTGYSHAEPKTQYVTHIFDEAVPNQDRVEAFKMTPELFEDLKKFQVKEGQSVDDKFNEIHTDLERNVTKVWERRDVAIAVDLIYHTTLSFYFQEQFIRKGWAELLIIGDSGQAKSTLVENLMRHYRLGEFYSGESSKRTGLVYSFQQTQKRWFLNWGAWPLNDGGLIIIDEFSGISEDDLALMSDVRSSGIARATGIITAETNARTRAIFLSNPRNGMQLNTETHGIQSVLKLLGKAEDVRRLDLVVGVASGDVDISLINRSIHSINKVPHVYTGELCRHRILWCWSRKPTQVHFTTNAELKILQSATEMGRKYSSKIPIVEAADQRLKIARLSIAAAGCMFSTEDGETLIVKEEHVEFVVNYMYRVYDAKNLDYAGFSSSNKTFTKLDDATMEELRSEFVCVPIEDLNSVCDLLYSMAYFNRNELQDATGTSIEDSGKFMSFLLKKRLLERTQRGYRKTPIGIALLKDIAEKPITEEEMKEAKKSRFKSYEY